MSLTDGIHRHPQVRPSQLMAPCIALRGGYSSPHYPLNIAFAFPFLPSVWKRSPRLSLQRERLTRLAPYCIITKHGMIRVMRRANEAGTFTDEERATRLRVGTIVWRSTVNPHQLYHQRRIELLPFKRSIIYLRWALQIIDRRIRMTLKYVALEKLNLFENKYIFGNKYFYSS